MLEVGGKKFLGVWWQKSFSGWHGKYVRVGWQRKFWRWGAKFFGGRHVKILLEMGW